MSNKVFRNEMLSEYNRKTIDYGNGRIDVIVYGELQGRILGPTIKKSNSQKFEISEEAQEKRTAHQMFAIKRRIKGYALCNMERFKWFVTLTLNPEKVDSLDYELSKEKLLKWFRLLRDRYGRFDYIIVPELHKSGAVHFHGLLSDIPAKFVEAKSHKNSKPIVRNGRQVYNLNDWEFGFSNCEIITNPLQTSSYITKYITQSLVSSKSMYRKKRYFVSQGLAKPKMSFEMSENSDLEEYLPNYAVITTDELGKNSIDLGIYKLQLNNDSGKFEQIDTDYLVKAKT